MKFTAQVVYEILGILCDKNTNDSDDEDIQMTIEETGLDLCGHEPTWNYAQGERSIYFDAYELKVTAKAWFTFICSYLAISSNPF